MKYLKWILAIIGTIILGALGSGVWQHILEPFIYSGRDFILTITTLGVQSFKDSTYVDISMGFHETASHELLSLSKLLYSYFIFVISVCSVIIVHDLKKKNKKILDKIERCERGECDQCEQNKENETLEDLRQQSQRKKRIINLLTKGTYVSVLLSIFLIILLSITSIRSNYINKAITHYEQLKNISFAYVDEPEEELIVSQFSQIKNKEDFIKIINNLETIAKENHKNTPTFKVW